MWEAYQFKDCSLAVWVSRFPLDCLTVSCVYWTTVIHAIYYTDKRSYECLMSVASDEPSSSSNDHDTTHIPASAVISSTPVITTIPPSPTSPSPIIRRQLSHDQGEEYLCQHIQYLSDIRNVSLFFYEFTLISDLDSLRLTILESDSGAKTERSRSFDEGLDNYREEGRG